MSACCPQGCIGTDLPMDFCPSTLLYFRLEESYTLGSGKTKGRHWRSCRTLLLSCCMDGSDKSLYNMMYMSRVWMKWSVCNLMQLVSFMSLTLGEKNRTKASVIIDLRLISQPSQFCSFLCFSFIIPCAFFLRKGFIRIHLNSVYFSLIYCVEIEFQLQTQFQFCSSPQSLYQHN